MRLHGAASSTCIGATISTVCTTIDDLLLSTSCTVLGLQGDIVVDAWGTEAGGWEAKGMSEAQHTLQWAAFFYASVSST